ncbi:hypothetical protein [Nocardia niigatensis]|uniref:hypothetical protein n=1 Tax=Nocardia niigatensis TaxID=209249 RepID=UPI0002E96E6A|nr:hypothetical protein [Nocardia niigatensis]
MTPLVALDTSGDLLVLKACRRRACMDLNTVIDVIRPPYGRVRSGRTGTRGTWLFSEPQPNVHRLVDLTE